MKLYHSLSRKLASVHCDTPEQKAKLERYLKQVPHIWANPMPVPMELKNGIIVVRMPDVEIHDNPPSPHDVRQTAQLKPHLEALEGMLRKRKPDQHMLIIKSFCDNRFCNIIQQNFKGACLTWHGFQMKVNTLTDDNGRYWR